MAKYRLKVAHQLRNADIKSDVWLPGDKENEHLGDEKGTLVGTDTSYPVINPTTEMVALDSEADDLIQAEEARLSRAQASMNPIDQLPVTLKEFFTRDDYEDRYIPGFDGKPRPKSV